MRVDAEGRDVTDLPGLWCETDREIEERKPLTRRLMQPRMLTLDEKQITHAIVQELGRSGKIPNGNEVTVGFKFRFAAGGQAASLTAYVYDEPPAASDTPKGS